MKTPEFDNLKIAVVGLGYVGLPLAVEFGKKFPTVGFDINENRIDELRAGKDSTLEIAASELVSSRHMFFTSSAADIESCNVYIVTVPTPTDSHQRPDLKPLQMASELIGKMLKKDDIVIYESTVYPGATEEVCVPLLEKCSGSIFNSDFFVGYSPERINPGDKVHTVTEIIKITSGSTPEATEFVDTLYKSIISAGTYKAGSIKVAEAAKVIENTQRDLNIALVNELAIIFNRLGIDTLEVLEAAGTKWNFLPFRPGLVGGNCISVDPYYLAHKAQEIGYHPEVILSGRRINDRMGSYVVDSVIHLMLKKRIHVFDANILILGLTFKENCPGLRNTQIVKIVDEFMSYHANVDIYDPWADPLEAKVAYNYDITSEPVIGKYDAVILAVSHDEFRTLGIDRIRGFVKDTHVIYDVKYLLPKGAVDGRL